ncbi:MAG: double zinc ribbon domain-containing protein [Bacillota bacterium]
MIGKSWTIGLFAILATLAVYFITYPKGCLSKCPHCGKKNLNILAFCNHCKKPVKHECLACHEAVPWNATICPYCKSADLTED